MNDLSKSKKYPNKGFYILPNLFTTAALFCGFFAIIRGINGDFEAASIAIYVAMILDALDGRVARMTNTQTQFGEEYDSLSDVISFGLAPSIVMYQWTLMHLRTDMGTAWGKLGWLAAFIYVACAALRLARFNAQVGKVDKRYFTGLPSPAAAGIMIGFIWMFHDLEIDGKIFEIPALFLTIMVGLLMVSNISYYSFKDINFKHKVPFFALLVMLLIFALASIDPPKVFFSVFLLYALSGPIIWVFRRYRKFKRRQKPIA